MNFDDFCRTERIAQRAVGAARMFASTVECDQMMAVSFLMAELRHAAYFLCDPGTPDGIRADAQARLLQLFTLDDAP
jgi:hypothetical protein